MVTEGQVQSRKASWKKMASKGERTVWQREKSRCLTHLFHLIPEGRGSLCLRLNTIKSHDMMQQNAFIDAQ